MAIILQVVLENNPDDKKLLGEIRQAEGDLTEKEVYEALKDYFGKRKESVLVINGNELPVVLGDTSKKQEMDFIIVNFTKQYLMNIEVKKFLGKGENFNSAIKAREQVETNKKIIEDSFGADLKGDWNYIPMQFFPEN